jgi:hypothetical protein
MMAERAVSKAKELLLNRNEGDEGAAMYVAKG